MKGDDVPLWNLMIIVISFGVLFVLGIRRKIKKNRKQSHRKSHKAKRK